MIPAELLWELAERSGIPVAGPRTGTVRGFRIADEDAQGDWIVFPTDAPASFLNQAMERTEQCSEWIAEMDRLVTAGAPPQKFIDCSEDILNEPIWVADPSMKRIACTQHRDSDDRFYSEIAKRGYPSPETYEEMGRGGYYQQKFYRGQAVRLQTVRNPALEVILQGIRIDGKLAATAVMLCENSPWSEAKTAMFCLLTDRLSRCLRATWLEQDQKKEQYEFLLQELLEGKTLSDEELTTRLRYTGLSKDASYVLAVFTASEDSVARLLYVRRALGGEKQQTRFLLSGGHLLCLLLDEKEEHRNLLAFLEKLCQSSQTKCAVSGTLPSLNRLKETYENACSTITLGEILTRPDSWYALSGDGERTRCLESDTFAPYRPLAALGGRDALRSAVDAGLLAVEAYDREHGTDDLRVLYLFLCCHQNYTDTAKRLYMHRNSVIYRIGRICRTMGTETIGTDRERCLQCGYMLLDLARGSE